MSLPKPDLSPALLASHQAVAWLREAAWPLWLAHGIDRERGGFRESLDLATLACPAPFRRLRVVARQVFVFAEAHGMGLPGAAEAVALGIDFLRDKALAADGGYARRFDLRGAVIDAERDLYDHAFVLLALASAAKLLPAEPLRRQALALMRYLDTRFPHPQGGYVESLPPALPRRQNPHMHLLEACLAAAEAFEEELFLRRAGELVQLLFGRLLHAPSGTLPEYFDDALLPLRQAGRHAVEPGHHCEWAWLLHWCQAVLPGRLPAERAVLAEASARLLRFVDRHGLNPRLGTAYDEVWSDGTAKAAGSRLWPQTERLKAEVLRPDATLAGILGAHAALDRYLRAAPRGLWVERLAEDGQASAEPAPASSLYHLTAGILVSHRHLLRHNPGDGH